MEREEIKEYKFSDILLPKFDGLVVIPNPNESDLRFWVAMFNTPTRSHLLILNHLCLFQYTTRMLNQSKSKYEKFESWRDDDIVDGWGLHRYLLFKGNEQDEEIYRKIEEYCKSEITDYISPSLEQRQMLWSYANMHCQGHGYSRMAKGMFTNQMFDIIYNKKQLHKEFSNEN